MSDDELYGQYLAGDASAGDRLMLQSGDAVISYLNSFLHNMQDAEDLMLDCFAELLVKKPVMQEGKFRAYLFRMARYKANRLWRTRFRRNEFSLDENVAALDDTPEQTVLKDERNKTLETCLNRIAPQYREAIYLVYESGMSFAQAAEVLGCNTKRIDNLLANGKKQMRKELEKEGITAGDIFGTY